MIIPSIDIMGENAVQLIGGKELEINAGDPRPLAKKFRIAGEIAVIDLDAALGKGNNEELIAELATMADVRVGGGIRSLESAIHWLDRGVAKIILGTKAVPEILKQLPRERVIAALDAVNGEIVVEGWQTKTGQDVLTRMEELRPYVGGFLVTFVEREGQLKGIDLDRVRELREAAGDCELTIAGGVNSLDEIASCDALGVDCQVGMAIYKGLMDLGEAITAPLVESEREDGLWPTVVCDETGGALGLCWSSKESIKEAVSSGRGVYHSRTRGLWKKGETSGATQELLRINLDCDRDSLRFIVRQEGAGFCHKDTWTCWGEHAGLSKLERTIWERKSNAPKGSYTARLYEEAGLLESKLREEARELSEASCKESVIWESADLFYFSMVKMAQNGVSIDDVVRELNHRSRRVSRRAGNSKGE